MNINKIEQSTIYVPVGNRIISSLEHITTYYKQENGIDKKIYLVFVKCENKSEIITVLKRYLIKCKIEGNMQKIRSCMEAISEFSDNIFLKTPAPELIHHIEHDIIRRNLRMNNFSYSYVSGMLILVEAKNLALSY